MAILDESEGKPREKTMKIAKKNDKKVYLIAHELKLARILAGNNKAARDRALKALKQWFLQRSKTVSFTEDDFQRIWKGLFYAMWMSDKPLIQEECAENVSHLIHFPMFRDSLLFFRAGITILINEWFGIDQLRLDKFLMLVRRLLRQMFFALKKDGFSKKNIEGLAEVLSNTILNTKDQPPIGLFMHFTELFLEEFAKVTNGNISNERFTDLLKPFIKKLIVTDDRRQCEHIKKFIFTYLIQQTDLGLEYKVKYEAWKREGFPGNINSMQKIKLDKDPITSSVHENRKHKPKQKPLDPRAGRVNVELPQIKFNPKLIAAALLEHKFDKDSNAKSRKLVSVLADQFTKLSNGIYPLGVQKVIDDEKGYDNIRKAANRLIKFENKLLGKNKKRKIKGESNNAVSEVKEKRRKIEENDKEQKQITNNKKSENNENQYNDEELADFISESNAGRPEVKVKRKKIVENGKEKQITNNKNSENNENQSNDEELAEFIEKSEGNINKAVKNGMTRNKITKKKSKKNHIKNRQTIIDNIECVFERNSGTWIVYDLSKEKEDIVASSQQSGPNPVKLFEPPQTKKELFPESEWDTPLQEGEYEICIPSKKYVEKIKTVTRSTQNIHEVVNASLRIKGKSRHSLDFSQTKNLSSTPSSTKKVKINTKLNRSQEVHEHHAQVLSSPGIPYDANKKPIKPLLKSVFNSSPINPFYNKQLNIF